MITGTEEAGPRRVRVMLGRKRVDTKWEDGFGFVGWENAQTARSDDPVNKRAG